jgi:hypothetical protein
MNLGDEGANLVASGLIEKLARAGKRLRRLDLSCNEIGDSGASAVVRAVCACPRDHLLAVRLQQVLALQSCAV